MKLILLLSLTAISGLFMIANSFSKSRTNLWPAAAIFLLIGGFLLSGTGLQIQQGTDYTYTIINNSTVVSQETTYYQKINNPLGVNSSQLIGLLYMIMGAGYIVMASPGRFRSILKR